MKINKISGFIALALFSVSVNGQVRQPHSLYFMNTIPQVTQMNPAFQPRANSYVTMPVNVNFDVLSDIAPKNILQQQGKEWYTPVEKQYDYDKLWKAIGKKATMFNGAADIDFGFGLRFGDGYITFGMSQHVASNNALPSDLFKVVEKGFPDGTKLDFSPMRAQGMSYLQFSFGYSHKINDKLTVGANVKPLLGQAAYATKIEKFKINTGLKQWDADVRGNIYSSAPIELTMKDDDPDKIEKIELNDFDNYRSKDWIDLSFGGFKNPGVAFDLGASYQLDDRITLSASLNNLGFISWKRDLNSVSFNGNYSFDGIFYDVSSDDDRDQILDDLLDELTDAVDYHLSDKKFRTPLAPVLNAGASYTLSRSVSAGFLSRTVFWKNAVRQSFNLSACLQPYSFVSFTAGLTYQVKGNVYFGGGLMFYFGPLPLQFFILTDYAPVYYSTVKFGTAVTDPTIPFPERQKSITVRTGLNLVFGRHGYTNKPMLDKGRSSWN